MQIYFCNISRKGQTKKSFVYHVKKFRYSHVGMEKLLMIFKKQQSTGLSALYTVHTLEGVWNFREYTRQFQNEELA